MLQAIIKKGKVVGEYIPAPNVSEGSILIKVVNSCISAGTEMSGVENSGKSLIKRALEQPAQLNKVINMAKSIGIEKTLSKIKGTLDAGNPTGYSVSGVAIAIGDGVNNFKVGDRVAAAGSGIAHHAEYVDVPVNLVMKIPNDLSFINASTVTLGAISMQGVRRADLRFGELCVVTGAGILGLLAIQMLQLSGVRVAVVDLDDKRLLLAKTMGVELVINPSIEDPVTAIENWSGGYGADCVIFAAATNSSEALSKSFQMTKKKGRVVLLGTVGMEINRSDIYKKELDFLISTSYGPGRYDDNYEKKGHDYPYSYVRWTENRNMTEYLRLLASNKINLSKMIEGVFGVKNITEAYEYLRSENKPLMALLDYGEVELDLIDEYLTHNKKIIIRNDSFVKNNDIINVALVGAGGFATGMHLPNMKNMPNKYNLYAVVNRSGHKAKASAEQFNAKYITTDYDDVLGDDNVDMVMIATRHDSHASLVIRALKAGKHVFVEKPLATNKEELLPIIDFYSSGNDKPVLFTAFNRRFSKYSSEIRKYTSKRVNPLFMHYRMNAGYIPLDHWVHESGGRIIGECCHIIDLLGSFVGERVATISVEFMTPSNQKYSSVDNKSIILKYEDGSVGHIDYFAVGNKKLPKEYLEVHFDNKSIVMDDYKNIEGYGLNIKNMPSKLSSKGQYEELEHLYDTLSGKNKRWPIQLWEMIQTTEITFEI